MCRIVKILRDWLSTPRLSEEEYKKKIIKDLIIQYKYTSGEEPIISFKRDMIDITFRKIDDKYECRGCGKRYNEWNILQQSEYDPDDINFYKDNHYSHICCAKLHKGGYDQRNTKTNFILKNDIRI